MAELISYSSLILIALFVVGIELHEVTANSEPSFDLKATPESASATSIGDKYQSDHHYANIYNSASFVTKIGSGFERLTVSVDSRLAFLSQKSASGINATSSSDEELKKLYPFSAYQNDPFLCKTILEQLKELVARTSDYLYRATKGQTYFRQVSILLPPSWVNVNCTGTYRGSSRLLFPAEELLTASSIPASAVHHAQSTADIHVTPDHPVYIDRPWTLQYGGCGVPGKRISIPVSFLTTGVHDPQVDLKARLLAREWIKYRYGVFDENGFDADERYPTKHMGQSKTAQDDTACVLNRAHQPSVKATSTLTSPHATNMDYNKTRQHDMSKDSQTTKSLMSLPLDSHTNEICDEHTHVRTTPTKHNFLCNGKSVWEVMRSHPDFHSQLTKGRTSDFSSTAIPSRSIVSAPPTSFSLGTPKMSRVIFLLDRTQAMNQNNRWINLRRSMYRMFHRVPAGVELGVISYTNVSVISLPLTVASTQNRDNLHGRVPLRPLTTMSEDACISCALKTAVQLLKFNGDSTNPASIILITSSSNLKSREWDKISKVIDSNPLRVTVVTYDDTLESGQFSTLTKHGELIRISESDVDNKSRNLEQSVILNNVLLKITSEHLGSLQYKIHELVQWPNSDWQVRGKFVIEESLGRNTFVTVTPEEYGDVDGLQLISPTGREFDLSLNAEGMIFLRIPGIAEPGMWSYTVKYYHSQPPRPTSIDVVTEARKSSDLISVKSWNTVHKLEQGHADVVLLYAQVTQGDLPVLNANLTVSIRLPAGNHDQDSKIVRVRLLDTGSGDPDITWGDGVYSAYFTQLGPISGVFGVSVEVNDNNEQAVIPVHTNITRGTFDKSPCCGSSVPHISTIPTGSFNRHIVGPSFVIYHGIPLGEDYYPPGRVTDLRAEQVDDSLSEIKLSWTAPGGDFDKGKASKYEIRCYTTPEALTDENFASQGILVSSSHTPEPESYGTGQNYVVPVPWRNDYFYYGIVAIDTSTNRGQVSNLVSVFIQETQTSTANLADARASSRSESAQNQSTTNHTHTNSPRLGSMWFHGLSESELYIVLAGAGALLILTSVLILSLLCIKTNNNKDEKSAHSHEYQNIYRRCENYEISRVEPYKIINNEVADFGFYWPFNCKKSAFPKESYQEVNERVSPETYISVPSFYNTPLNSYVDQHNDQYCDIYASNTRGGGSSSGESKESDGESEATTQLTYDSLPNPQNVEQQQELALQLPCSSCDPLSCSSCANFPPLVEEEKCESMAECSESCRNEIANNEPIYKNQQFIKNNILQAAIPRPSCGLGRTMSVCDNIGCNERPQQYSRGSMISIPNDIYGSRRKRRHVSFV